MHDLLAQLLQVGFFAALIRIATPLIFATLGELLAERSGVVNLGVDRIMLFSAMTGFTGAFYSGDLWIGIAFYFYRLIFGEPSHPPSVTPFRPLPFSLLSDIPVIGPVLFNQFALSYL